MNILNNTTGKLEQISFSFIEDSAPHQLSSTVNEIEKLVPFTKKYGRGYWLRKCKGHSFGEVMSILKTAKSLKENYNLGGFITNKLKSN